MSQSARGGEGAVSKAGGGQGLIYLQRGGMGAGWGGVGGARGVLLVPPLGRREVLAGVFRYMGGIMSALVHVASAERHGGQAGTWGRGGFYKGGLTCHLCRKGEVATR